MRTGRWMCVSFVAAVASASPARADDVVGKCLSAFDQAQASRRNHALVDARASFLACSSEQCPAVVRADCVKALSDLDERIPTVSVRVTGTNDADVVDAHVTIDGRPVSAGQAAPFDPGSHALHAEAPGYESQDRTVLLAEGEHARTVTLALVPSVKPGPVSPLAPVPPPPPRRDEEGRKLSPLVLALGGVGVVALGSFATFGLIGHSQASDLRDGCGKTSTCNPSDVDAARTKYYVADVSLLVGVVALGAAATLFIVKK